MCFPAGVGVVAVAGGFAVVYTVVLVRVWFVLEVGIEDDLHDHRCFEHHVGGVVGVVHVRERGDGEVVVVVVLKANSLLVMQVVRLRDS